MLDELNPNQAWPLPSLARQEQAVEHKVNQGQIIQDTVATG